MSNSPAFGGWHPGSRMVLLALLAAAPPVAWVASYSFGLALPIDSLQLALWVIVLAPVLEEVAFRSLLQRGLFETLVSRTRHAAHLSNLLTAVAFAASHWPAQGSRALLWLVPALLIGEIWRRSEKLWMCVLTHSWFNACLAWTSAFG